MKKLFFVIMLILIAVLLCSCRMNMKTADEATADIREHLLVDFELISSETEGDEWTYTYRDENGIEFHYYSNLIRPFKKTNLLPRVDNVCDYAKMYVDAHKTEIESIFAKYGIDFFCTDNKNGNVFEIYVKTRADVETVTDAVYEIISTVGSIPLKSGTGFSVMDRIDIHCSESGYYEYNTNVQFIRYGEEISEDDIHYRILRTYVETARDGETEQNDLTDSDYVTCPASKMYITYEETDTDDFCFSYYMGEYSMDFFDIMPSKHEYVTAFSFKAMCEKFGIPCENTVTGLKWTVGGHEYYSEYSKKHKDMKIYRDNAEICSLPVEALTMYEQSYFCTVTPDDLALMLNCKYKIDYKLGRIYFNAN